MTPDPGRNRADYDVVSVTGDRVTIVDLDLGGRSVTNDAAAVVRELIEAFGPRRLFYVDSDGQTDELLHDGARFMGFGPGESRT